jgi:hypothetical protein
VRTTARPELRQPVAAFAAKLAGGVRSIPLAELAQLFGVSGAVLDEVRRRGDIKLTDDTMVNDGPDLVVPAGMVEVEIPMIVRGSYRVEPDGFVVNFPSADFAPRACVQIAILRKCFELKEMRATARDLTLDFANEMVDQRYTW